MPIGTTATELGVEPWTLEELSTIVFGEARLADEHNYDGWESLWTDDALYWVPIGRGNDEDPGSDISIIFDNRSRLGTRLKQLRTGHRYAQSPPSKTRRLISNLEIISRDGDDVKIAGNFILMEARPRGIRTWAGRTTWGFRKIDGNPRLFLKKVELIDSDDVLNTLGFLI